MTRVFTDGAEAGDTLFFSVAAAGMTNVSTKARSGSRSYFSNSNALTTKALGATYSDGYVRLGVLVSTAAATGTAFEWRKGTTVLGSLRTNTAGYWDLYTGTGTIVATSTQAYAANVWYLIEIRINIADAGTLEWKIDGVTQPSFSGDTKPGADTGYDTFNYCDVGTQEFYFDDLAFDDAAWCGEGRIVALIPNGSGVSTQWTPSTGANWSCVDEVPPNTTDYVSGSASSLLDMYDLSAFSPTGVTIISVYPEARVLKDSAGTEQVYLPVRSGSTTTDGTAVTVPTASYSRIVGDRRTVNPTTGVAWTEADLASLQAGVKYV